MYYHHNKYTTNQYGYTNIRENKIYGPDRYTISTTPYTRGYRAPQDKLIPINNEIYETIIHDILQHHQPTDAYYAHSTICIHIKTVLIELSQEHITLHTEQITTIPYEQYNTHTLNQKINQYLTEYKW